MRMSSDKYVNYMVFPWWLLCVWFCLTNLACDREQADKQDKALPRVYVLPQEVGVELFFRGYVTNVNDTLVSQIHDFRRKVVRKDSIDGRAVYVYTSNDQEHFYFTDDAGTVWEKKEENIGLRLSKYGFVYRRPVMFSRWQILLKQDQGQGTEWADNIDTTLVMENLAGEKQKIRYQRIARARNEGIQQVYIPRSKRFENGIDAHWFDLQTHIINVASGDTLFSTVGSAHQYFLPDLGSAKYVTDYVQKELNSEPVPLKGTWEMVRAVR